MQVNDTGRRFLLCLLDPLEAAQLLREPAVGVVALTENLLLGVRRNLLFEGVDARVLVGE